MPLYGHGVTQHCSTPLLSCGPNPVRWLSDPNGARPHHAHTAETAYAAFGKAERRARRVTPEIVPSEP